MGADTEIVDWLESWSRLGRSVVCHGFAIGLLLVLLCAGGCREKVRFPLVEDVFGPWRAEGKSYKDPRTYSGIYDFHRSGEHTYDIVLSTGESKKGRGVWSLEVDKGTLRVQNDTGSIYVGTFERGKPRSVSLLTINNQWGVQLDKATSGAPAKTATP